MLDYQNTLQNDCVTINPGLIVKNERNLTSLIIPKYLLALDSEYKDSKLKASPITKKECGTTELTSHHKTEISSVSEERSNFFIDIPSQSTMGENKNENGNNNNIIIFKKLLPENKKKFQIINVKAQEKPQLQVKKQKQTIKKEAKKINSNDLMKIYLNISEKSFLGKKRITSKPLEFEQKELKSIEFDPISVSIEKINLNTLGNLTKLQKGYILRKVKEIKAFQKRKKSCLEKRVQDPCLNSTSKSKQINFSLIINPFESSFRNEYADILKFQRKFKEDYDPIQMQKENENINNNTHFIKKKQSAVNIKRHCGVSYVIKSESEQKFVKDRYKPLGHLVYQGTYSISQLSNDEAIQYCKNKIEEELMNKPLVISFFESPDEDEMKEFLLFPEKRKSISKE